MRTESSIKFLGVILFVFLSAHALVAPRNADATRYEGKGPFRVVMSVVPGQGLLFSPKEKNGESADRKWPAIVFAHGLCSPSLRYSDTLETLASWGFFVLANEQQEDCGEANIRHPLKAIEDFFVPGGKFSQASDSSVMAGHVKKNLSYLKNRTDVDTNALALVGHSMGGGVIIDVAADLASSDPDVIKAVISIAPWNGVKPTPSSVVGKVRAPLLIFCSMADALCPCSGPATITDTRGPFTQPASVGIPILFGPGADIHWNGGPMAIYEHAAKATLMDVKDVSHFTIAGTNGKQMQALSEWATVRYGLNFNHPKRPYGLIPTLEYSLGFLHNQLHPSLFSAVDLVSDAKKDGRISKVMSK